MLRASARHLLNRCRLTSVARMHAQMLVPQLRGRRWRSEHRWSQHDEDAWLARELSGQLKTGYYVDVGANHPARLSNTFRLYNLGMRGICVEPNEVLCDVIARYRPEDEVVCAAVGDRETLAKFYELWRHDFSTFSEPDYRMRIEMGHRLRRVVYKPVFRLSTILAAVQVEARHRFALLSVDTEGWDEMVLRSNDWQRFRPQFAVVEANTAQAEAGSTTFLRSVGYERVATFGVNGIFRDTTVAAVAGEP